MAVDETELSFIRCPNCRSLVPAVATRCRMCGFILKGAEESASDERPSRVRQRTVFVPSDEIPEVEDDIVEESITAEEGDEFLVEAAPEDDYLEEGADNESVEDLQEAPATPTAKRKRRRRKKKKPANDFSLQESIPPQEDAINRDVVAPWRSTEPRAGFHTEITPEIAPEAPLVEERKTSPASEGALFGWFVSYNEDKKGVSREVRIGRFFVGAEQLRPSDFVIADQSVSTPQCLVVCDPSKGIYVQDLMSEQGTFIKRAGATKYERHSEQVQLQHGDFIRFGSYEMLFVALSS